MYGLDKRMHINVSLCCGVGGAMEASLTRGEFRYTHKNLVVLFYSLIFFQNAATNNDIHVCVRVDDHHRFVDVAKRQIRACRLRAKALELALDEFGGNHPVWRMPDCIPRFEMTKSGTIQIPEAHNGMPLTFKHAEYVNTWKKLVEFYNSHCF